MSNSSKDNSNPSSMIDVDFTREWDGSTVSVTVYDGDFTECDNLIHQGYRTTNFVIVL